MRAVIYTRVSQDKRDRASVQQQEDEARLAAAALGWTVVRVFVDNDVSASRHARKERVDHAALLEYLATGQVDVLIMWESSRGDRKLTTWSGLLDLCRDLGVKIHVVDHRRTYDLSVPREWKTLADEGVNNAYASEETRERILRDVRANATAGRPHGKLAYGYSREYDERGIFVREYERPEEAAVVRDAARRVLAGDSLYVIAQDLNAREVPAPRGGKWLPTQVKRLLTNPRYVGQRVHKGVVIGDAVWPAILEEATYLECKAILEDPRRSTVRDLSLKYLLSGTAKCGVCGAKMRVVKNRGYFAYACFERYCTGVKVEYLEEYVVEIVLRRLSRPDFLDTLARPADGGGGPAAARDEAHRLQERLDAFYESAAAGEISPGALAKIERRLLADIEAAQARAQAVTVSPLLRTLAGPDIRERWASLTVGTRREVIDLLMVIKVNKTVRGSRFRPERVDIEWRTV